MNTKRLNGDYGAVMTIASSAASEQQQATWRQVDKASQVAVNKGLSDARFAARRALLSPFMDTARVVRKVGHKMSKAQIIDNILDKGYSFSYRDHGRLEFVFVFEEDSHIQYWLFTTSVLHTDPTARFRVHRNVIASTSDVRDELARRLNNDYYKIPVRLAKSVLVMIHEMFTVISAICDISELLKTDDTSAIKLHVIKGIPTEIQLRSPDISMAYMHGENYERFQVPGHFDLGANIPVQTFVNTNPRLIRDTEVYNKLRDILGAMVRTCHTANLV